jgi:hypothetical protein
VGEDARRAVVADARVRRLAGRVVVEVDFDVIADVQVEVAVAVLAA